MLKWLQNLRPPRIGSGPASTRASPPTSLGRSPDCPSAETFGGNRRGPIYAAIRAEMKRVLTPDEKIRLDRVLDSLGVKGRYR